MSLYMNESNAVLKIDMVYILEQMLDCLFKSDEEVIISYSWNQGAMYIFRDGVELDLLEEVYRKYCIVKQHKHLTFTDYDSMVEVFDKEHLRTTISFIKHFD